LGSKSQAIGTRNAASSHPRERSPVPAPKRAAQADLGTCRCACRGEKHVPGKHHFKPSGRDSGLVASLLTNTLNPITASRVDGGGEGRSSTRSLGVLIQGIASSLAFQRAPSPSHCIAQLPARTQAVTGNAALPTAMALRDPPSPSGASVGIEHSPS